MGYPAIPVSRRLRLRRTQLLRADFAYYLKGTFATIILFRYIQPQVELTVGFPLFM